MNFTIEKLANEWYKRVVYQMVSKQTHVNKYDLCVPQDSFCKLISETWLISSGDRCNKLCQVYDM